MDDINSPPLPEPIIFPDKPLTDEPSEESLGPPLPTPAVGVTIPPTLPPLYYLSNGCYFTQWILPHPSVGLRYDGVIRVERHVQGVTASGDLYRDSIQAPVHNPKHGIPIFRRERYSFYLRITKVLEKVSLVPSFTLGFERYWYNQAQRTWKLAGDFTAEMTFKPPPPSYPSKAVYLEGQIKNSSGAVVGHLKMGKVSNFLRKAIVEVDRVSVSEYPADSGTGVDWQDVYKPVDWDVIVYQSHTNLPEISGESWSNAELHAQMLKSRYSANLDREWRYHLLCVRQLDATSRGIMYDAYGSDSNNLPREGAAMSSHWIFPNSPPWGLVAGQRFGAAAAPYFRTAVHEVGHAMGLYHNFADNGFMNVTPNIAASPGTFPNNVQWSFNAEDKRRLRHMPDPWVRPGMIPFGKPYSSAPISPIDELDIGEALSLKVTPLLPTVPLGAPVRVRVTMRNQTDTSIEIPASLSLKSGHVSGSVIGPGGSSKGFKSVMLCIDEHDHRQLESGEEISHDLTLLRGLDGALFPGSGLHEIMVKIAWDRDAVPVCICGSASVMVTPALTDSHARAALKTLSSPDLLLTLVMGGDHLEDGIEALQAALADETLAPHFAVIEAKRLGTRFQTRDAKPAAALRVLRNDTIMSASEVKKVVPMVKGVSDPTRPALEILRKSAMGDRIAEDMTSKLLI